jgi:uncharacterized protein (TIGR02145 family)
VLYADVYSTGFNDPVVFSADSSKDPNGTFTCQWKFGNGVWAAGTSGDTTVNAPATAGAWVCSLKVTDNDGEVDYDEVTITVESNPPEASASATPLTAGLNDPVVFKGSALDSAFETVTYAWKFGTAGAWVNVTNGDTTVNSPATLGAWVCSLKVTDNDGEVDYDTVIIHLYGEITDADGNTYYTVQIGNQEWTVENLKTTKYNDGTTIPLVTDNSAWSALTTPGRCWYDNDSASNNATYGVLYNWYAVNTGKLAPVTGGWRVPTDADWTALSEYLGGELVAGGKMKEAGTTHWISPNTGATNESGFSALPGGCRGSVGGFSNQSSNGDWWSATEIDASYACTRNLYYGGGGLYWYIYNKMGGFSVRLVRDLN